jgi:hypothetical protein
VTATRFSLGQIFATPGALDACLAEEVAPSELLARHASGDWGDVPPEDTQENEFGLEHGLRLLSTYALPSGRRVWVLTESDRSRQVLLLPSEY